MFRTPVDGFFCDFLSAQNMVRVIEGKISIGNGMISSDIWHKYHEWYFKIVLRNFTSH